MTKRDNDGEDGGREQGLVRIRVNRLGETAARLYHQTAVAMDRVIRRLENPAPDRSRRIEPDFGSASAPAPAPRGGVMETLMAVDGLTMEASVTALEAVARINPEEAGVAQRDAVRALADGVARAAEGYVAITAETLGLATPLPDGEPVLASGLERRFAAVIAAAEAMLARDETVARKGGGGRRTGR